MLLEDRVRINAPASRIFDFFDAMAQNYTRWHPDHRRFDWHRGDRVAVGNVFSFEEVIAGKLLAKKVIFTEVQREHRMAFVPTNPLMRLFLPEFWFETRQDRDETEFVAGIRLRVGPLAARLNRKEFAAVRQHMHEEGRTRKS